MADLYTSKWEEAIIDQVIHYGLQRPKTPKHPKYGVLRLALAKSLRLETPPDDSFDSAPAERGSEYKLDVLTGRGKSPDSDGAPQDFDDAVRALLSVYHKEDLFTDDHAYRIYLQRHIRRGLYEIGTTWNRGHDFIAYLQEELFAGLDVGGADEAGDERANDALLYGLREVGVQAEIRECIRGPRLDRYLLHLEKLDHYDILSRGLFKLALSLGMQQEGLFLRATDEPKVVGLDVPRKPDQWRPVGAAGLPEWADSRRGQAGLPAWLGQNVLGGDFSFDLADAPHLLVAGTTGSGKSVTLHALIASLLWTQTPDTLRLALIDPKQSELGSYDGLPGLVGEGVMHQLGEISALLDGLVEEMERRGGLLREAGVSNLTEGLQRERLELPRIVVVVEELADLLMQSRELEAPLVRLAQKARAAGIHLVLATQRPDATTFSGLLRSNIPGRIALRVQKASESRIILDQTGAEKLLGKGDMMVKLPSSHVPERVHGAYLTPDDIRAAIRHFTQG